MSVGVKNRERVLRDATCVLTQFAEARTTAAMQLPWGADGYASLGEAQMRRCHVD
jgi:hypothetical protein